MRQVQSTSIEDKCHQAILDFIQNLSADESELFEATEQSQQLIDDLRQVDSCQKGSVSRKIAPNIAKFVTGVEQYGTALDVLAGSVSLMSPIWASVRVVLSVAKAFGEYFGKLSSMLEEIGENLSTIRRYPRLYPDNRILQEAMVDIFQAIVQFCVKARNVFHQGEKHQKGVRAFTPVGLHTAWKLLWKPFNSQFGGIIGDIKSAMARIQHEVDVAEKELASEERGKAERERQRQTDRWDNLESNQKSVTQFIDQQRISHVKNWLSPVNAASNHNSATRLRHDGTGVWFLESRPFQDWLATEHSFLWLHAIPGAGKTVLASTVINYLREQKQNRDVALAYFYCDYKDAQKQSPRSIISTLLSMIASQNGEAFGKIQAFFDEQLKENPAYVPEFDELLNHFSEFVGDSFEEIFIVIDALDESEDRECVASATKSIFDSCRSAKILVTSRNEVDIARTYEDLPNTTIEPDDVAGDIRMYVESEVAAKIKARKLKLRDPNLSLVITNRLIQGAHGMFQWVKCQVDQLCRWRNDKAIRNALDDLPKSLHDTYFRILQKLENENKDEVGIVHRLLKWLVRGVRNLTLSELAECVSIVPSEAEDSFDFDAVFTDPEDVIELCGSLVSHSGNGSVGLAHYTVKEFLVSDSLKQVMPQFWVGHTDVHTELASVCLTYLCYDDFSEDQGGDGGVLLQRLEQYKFLSYAAHSWGTHARLSDANEDVFDLTMRLFESTDTGKGNYKLWCRTYQYLQHSVGRVLKASNCTPLYFASLFGLPAAVSALIQNNEVHIKEPMKAAANSGYGDVVGVYLDKCHPVDPTILAQCLYVAASRGHDKLAQQLLDIGVDVNSHGGKNGTALQVAALEGRNDVVSVLLDYGADMNVTCKRYGVPLSAAAEKGHLHTFQKLLDHGADVNGRGGWYAYPLVSAVVGKNLQIVKALLDNATDVNAVGGRHGCALMAAAYMDMLDLIRLLVDHGAKVNDENDKGSDALYAACIAGNLGAAKLLLELGADINAKGGKHRNALNAASAEGHIDIVKHLLDEGADVKFYDEHYGNSVQIAAFAGHTEIVRVLARAGVDVNASGGDRGTALVAAAQNGHLEVISLLFELGVPSGDTYEMDNAIMVAARRGHIEVVEALIDAGAVMNETSTLSTYPKCTPLEAAAGKSNGAMIQVLLDRGADVNYLNEGRYSTPLMAAILSEQRNLDIIRMLVEGGADINTVASPDVSCSCALGAAIYVKDYDICTYLIERGADVNVSRQNCYSCLQRAAVLDDERFIDLLLANGADVNLEVEACGENNGDMAVTALQAAALSGPSKMIHKLVDHGALFSIDSEDCHFKSALHAAGFRGDTEIIRALIELGDDVNVVGGTYGTALQAAAEEGEIEAIELLLEAGADINIANVGWRGSALFAAVAEDKEDAVKLLIEKGADVNSSLTKEYKYAYAIQSAARNGYGIIVQILLDSGAEVNAKGGTYCTALQAAASENLPHMCRKLLEHGADANIVGGMYGTALQAAYQGGYYEVIWLLFDYGASHAMFGGMYGTALGGALYGSCQTLVIQLLRHYHVDPNAPVRKYGSPVQASAVYDREDDVIDYLIWEDVDLNARGGLYGNALIGAVATGNGYALTALLDAGADVNLEGNKYYPTAAHAAIGVRDFPTLKLLAEHGADLHVCNGVRGSTLEYAAYKGSLPVVRYLISQGVDVNIVSPSRYGTALQAAAMSGKHDVLKYLVKHGADINARGGKFGTPLTACLLNGTSESVELLLKKGANPNAKAGIYGNPLQAASAAGDLDAVLTLLHYGADVNARGGKFCTALQASCVKGYSEITGLLIERGADVNVVGGFYRCALHAAAVEGWDEGCELLMRNGAEWHLIDRKASHLSEETLNFGDEMLQEALERQDLGWPELSDSEDKLCDGEEVEDDDDEGSDEDSEVEDSEVEDSEDEDSDGEEESEGDDDEDDESEGEESGAECEEEEKVVLPWNVDSIPFFDAPYVYRVTAAADIDAEHDSASHDSREASGSSGTGRSHTGDLTISETTSGGALVSVVKTGYSKDWRDLEWLQIADGDIGPED